MKETLYKTHFHDVEVKSQGEDGKLHIKAYACAFGNVDSWGDIIAPTACDDFLKSEDASRMKLCYQHDAHEVIGVITDMGVDAIGMWIEADILDTATGSDVQKLIKAGAINEFSIGFYADKYHLERREGYDYDIRVLDAITIVEVSPVTRAANPKAILLDAKSTEDMSRSLQAMSAEDFQALKTAVDDEFARRVLLNL
jgi:HK97 family phage prohead protease